MCSVRLGRRRAHQFWVPPDPMSSSCKGLLTKYAECLRKTECMKSGQKTLKDCMAEHAPECEQFRYALFTCRKGQVDARTRIQGNKGF